VSVHKISFKETFGDLIDAVFSVNAPLWYTFKLLFVNPGKLFREYLDGKRKSYYKPVGFFILMTVVYLIIRSLINYDPFANNTLNVKDETTGQLLTEARNFMLLNMDKFLFIFVFTLGIFMKLFFFRKNTFAEFLAIAFYHVGVFMFLVILNMFYIQYVDSNFQLMAILFMLGYFIYSLISFFQKNKVIVLFKSLPLYCIAFMSYGFSAFALSFLIVWLKHS